MMDGAPVSPQSDAAEIGARLTAALTAAEAAEDPRAAAVAALAAALEEGAETVARLIDEPGAGRRCAALQTEVTDLVVRGALDFVASAILPNPTPTKSDAIAVVAIGGYGRGEMAPFSDVDLMFLTPYKQTPWVEGMIEATLYILWDLKLKVGQSVRSVSDCLRLAKSDYTIRTSLLEKRYLWGDRALTEDLAQTLRRDLFAATAVEFVEAKLAERDARHSRHGGSRYLVEPNVKEGKGGLRDLQTLYWIAKYIYDVETPADLLAKGVFEQEEFETFTAAEAFLWTVRCHLHLVAGRAQEQLTFDHQVEISERMGFEPTGGKRAVEVFMQAYYRHAQKVGELTRFFCTGLEADQKKKRPGVGAALMRVFSFSQEEKQRGFYIRDGRLDVGEEAFLDEDPRNVIRLFAEALRTGALIHPNAFRLVARRLDLVEAVREDPEANRIFLDTLLEGGDPERALRRMNESGALGAFIPEFDRIVALMQFNMYHHYTVDEHTINAIGLLKKSEDGLMRQEFPVVSKVLDGGVDRAVLYVALFLHDIGKGRPEPHEEVGAEIAARLCPRLGLDEGQTDLVVWLVRHHLVMSDYAQKRDISDPATVEAFAAEVRSVKRLKLLLVLTAHDIFAVGPGTWNNWKAQLLRSLYYDTLALLDVGSAGRSRAVRVEEAQEALRAELADWAPERVESWLSRHYAPYWLGLDGETHLRLARLSEEAAPDKVASVFDLDPGRDATRVSLYMPDHPGVFSRMAGAFALAGASVVHARTFTSTDGMASSVFWVQDADGGPYETDRHKRLKAMIDKALAGEFVAREALRPKRNLKRRERPFDVPTTISFDNASSELYTVIEVDTRDRVGLLHDLTRSLSAANINIFAAVVTTYGEQAVDSFYVKDLFGFKITTPSKQRTIERKLREAIGKARDEALEQA